jgi:hypothetical protein
MTSQPSGIPTTPAARREEAPTLRAALRPWRRRIGWLFAVWLSAVGATFALGLSPDVPGLLAVLLAGAALVWHAMDHTASQHVTMWPLVDGELGRGGRGNDFRVANLAGRLEAANTRGEGRESLVHDLHVQLQVIIRERLFAKHGIVAEEEPRWAQRAMPPELWEFLVTLPPPDLYRPERLDPILRRIEQW